MGRRLALLIATYAYQDAGLRRLTAPAHDAEALADVLRDPQIAGFEVTQLVNKPHYEVGEAIGDLYRDRRRDDLTLLYFTGHGLKDDEGRLHLAMTNTRRDNLAFTSLPAELVDQAMSSCMSRQKVLILDCCYSGAFPAGRLAKAATGDVHALERFQGRGRTVLTASDATQYSFEGDKLRGRAAQSVFTRHLVQGLRDGSADLDDDGNITLDELYSYVYDKVVDEMPQQRPKRMDSVEGRILIARNIHWIPPADLQQSEAVPATTPVSALPPVSASPPVAAAAGYGSRIPLPMSLRAIDPLTRRHALRLGAAAASGILLQGDQRLPSPGTLRWQYSTHGSVISSPTVADGVVYVGSTDNNLYAIDAVTGEHRWRYTIKEPVYSSPTVADGVVYFSGEVNNLYAIDAATGKYRWHYEGDIDSSPTVADGMVYFGSNNANLYGIDAATGKLRWQYNIVLASYSSSPTVADGVMYVSSDDGGLYAIDITSRKALWNYRSSDGGSGVYSSPTVFGGVVYVGSDDHTLYAIDTITGKHRWHYTTKGEVASPTVSGGMVYFGSYDANLYAVDAAAGKLRWRYTTKGAVSSSPAVADGVVYVGSDDANLYAVDAASGNEHWRRLTKRGVNSSPTVVDGVVYVGSGDSNLYAVTAAGSG
ncbi:PQQ-binding-like beta-propeller repeat protein [Streptomyces sp. NPDC050636]|uniref:caspase, EACC1-associated type n=1 Tax=Streptomyces sp. NPDC050636 TaxID=3154510 RepID=UPI00341EC378